MGFDGPQGVNAALAISSLADVLAVGFVPAVAGDPLGSLALPFSVFANSLASGTGATFTFDATAPVAIAI